MAVSLSMMTLIYGTSHRGLGKLKSDNRVHIRILSSVNTSHWETWRRRCFDTQNYQRCSVLMHLSMQSTWRTEFTTGLSDAHHSINFLGHSPTFSTFVHLDCLHKCMCLRNLTDQDITTIPKLDFFSVLTTIMLDTRCMFQRKRHENGHRMWILMIPYSMVTATIVKTIAWKNYNSRRTSKQKSRK